MGDLTKTFGGHCLMVLQVSSFSFGLFKKLSVPFGHSQWQGLEEGLSAQWARGLVAFISIIGPQRGNAFLMSIHATKWLPSSVILWHGKQGPPFKHTVIAQLISNGHRPFRSAMPDSFFPVDLKSQRALALSMCIVLLA